MLRAVRLAAKLNVAIDPKTAAPIPKLAPLIQNVPAARLFDEMQKLLLSGHAVETLRSLRAHGLSHGLLPMIDVILEQPLGQRFIDLALADTDLRVRDGRGVSPGFLFATLLWHEVLRDVEGGARRRRKADSGAVRGDGHACSRSRRRRSRYRAGSRRRSRRSGRCSRASSSAPASVRTGCSSIRAFAPAGTFWICAAAAASSKASSRELATWWDRFANADDRRARGDAASRTRARSGAAADAAAGASARAAERAAGRRSVRPVKHDARVPRPRQQPRPSAPPARARGPRRSRGCRACASSPSRRAMSPRRSAARRAQPDYVNAVVAVETALAPAGAARCACIRSSAASTGGASASAKRNASRTLDIDLLLYGRRRMRVPGLTVPHPRMHERAFVLRPLADVAAVATIPGRGLARRFLAAVRGPAHRAHPLAFSALARFAPHSRWTSSGAATSSSKVRSAPARRASPACSRIMPAARSCSSGPRTIRSSSASTATCRASRCATQLTFLFQRADQLRRRRPVRHVPPPDGGRLPARQGSAVRAPQPVRRRVPPLREGLFAPEAANADARPRRSTCRRRSTR